MDHVVIVRAEDMLKVNTLQIKGVLVIADESYPIERREAYPYRLLPHEEFRPFLLITPELADRLLRTAGSSLAELDEARASQAPGKMQLTESGADVSAACCAGNHDREVLAVVTRR